MGRYARRFELACRKVRGVSSWAGLVDEARRRHGVVTLTDVRRHGIAERTFRRRTEAEAWPQLHRGVWALPGTPETPLRDCAAALALAGPGAALARRSAGWLWGLRTQAPARAEIILPNSFPPVRRPEVTALRSRSFELLQATRHAGLTVTTAARSIGDLAAVTSTERLLELVVQARQRGLIDLPSLVAQVARMRKAPGMPRLRAALDLLDGEQVDSMLEREVRRGLRGVGLPAPLPEPLWLDVRGRRRQIDIAWPSLLVGIEVDGFAHHQTAADMARDHAKANALAAEGWVLLRVGYLRWRDDRVGFLGEVRRVLGSRGLHVARSFPANSGRK